MKRRLVEIALAALVLVGLTLVIWWAGLDLRLAGTVVGPDNSWPGVERPPWGLLYRWAPLPAFVLAGVCLLLLVAGFFSTRWRRVRRDALFIILLLALGPGLLVNVALKDHVGRARPREVVQFGGSHRFTEIWQPGSTGRNSSFPSGHASVAFFLIAPWFVLRRRHRTLALAFLAGGTLYGLAVGWARILQGGHFLSDVLWAGGLVYLTGAVLALLMRLDAPRSEAGESRG
ncbi:MAG TPA: phosphatase PAP2 family protein [Desulfobulbus sp.]|nr:phosphatase PAP2 family protein [Desulfobulbus sp.]